MKRMYFLHITNSKPLLVILLILALLVIGWPDKIAQSAAGENRLADTKGMLPTDKKGKKDGATMVLIPAGPYRMGSKEGAKKYTERPRFEVYLEAYYIWYLRRSADGLIMW